MYAQQSVRRLGRGLTDDRQSMRCLSSLKQAEKGLAVAVSRPKRVVVGSDQPWPDYSTYEPTIVYEPKVASQDAEIPSLAQFPEY